MTDITYTHEPPAEADAETGYPESTLSLRLDVDGIGLSWTLRGTDESMSKRLPRVLEYLRRLHERLPKVAPVAVPPQPPLEDREDWCPIHHKPLVKQSNERGSWFSHQVPGEGWCRGKRRKAGA
jgi:hypothetical protein